MKKIPLIIFVEDDLDRTVNRSQICQLILEKDICGISLNNL